jgi:hypothetical protein
MRRQRIRTEVELVVREARVETGETVVIGGRVELMASSQPFEETVHEVGRIAFEHPKHHEPLHPFDVSQHMPPLALAT